MYRSGCLNGLNCDHRLVDEEFELTNKAGTRRLPRPSAMHSILGGVEFHMHVGARRPSESEAVALYLVLRCVEPSASSDLRDVGERNLDDDLSTPA